MHALVLFQLISLVLIDVLAPILFAPQNKWRHLLCVLYWPLVNVYVNVNT